MSNLSNNHWNFEDYKQVVNRKEAQEILADRFLIVNGRMREFKVKHIGAGMYEVFKKPQIDANNIAQAISKRIRGLKVNE